MNPIEFSNIIDLAKHRAAQHPDRNYVTFLKDGDDDEAFLSYAELDQTAQHVAGYLQQQGLEKGDRAFVILPNSLEFVNIFYGCMYAGILPVPLSEPAGPHQLQVYLENFIPTLKVSQPKALITTAPLAHYLKTQLPEPLQKAFTEIHVVSDEALLQAEKAPYTPVELEAEDTAYLQFTSGSTGTPKGIMIGHSNLMANMEQAEIGCDWEEGYKVALWLPLFHDFGLAAGLIGGLYRGGSVALMTPAHFIRKPVRWLKMISKYKCNNSYAPPFAYDLCVRKVDEDAKKELDLSSWVCTVCGAEPVHAEAVKAFNDTFQECGLKPNTVRPGFGMAEMVIMFSVSPQLETLCVDRDALENAKRLELADEQSSVEKKHLVNLGPQMPKHELAILGPNGDALPEGEVGEILVAGPSVCQGYYRNPEATEDVFKLRVPGKENTFLRTGDLGLLWKGNLYFAGRIKDLIIIRGKNYYPQDIEFALTRIKEVRPGCIVAYASESQEGPEQLSIAMELRPDLLQDASLCQEYVIPSVDKKVVELIGNQFQIHPSIRSYLKPGTVAKTSSGKIKHQANKKTFQRETFEGLLYRVHDVEEAKPSEESMGIEGHVMKLFEKHTRCDARFDVPIPELGCDSIHYVEFMDAMQRDYPNFDPEALDEASTLADIVGLLSAS